MFLYPALKKRSNTLVGYCFLFQNIMSGFIESPFMQGRQILALSPTSQTSLNGSQTPSSNVDQYIMPIHQIAQNQKQSILPDTGKK